jgi:hypothetical protein
VLEDLSGARPRSPVRVHPFFSWLRRVAKPPRGAVLSTHDGARYTGVALVEENEVKLLFALRLDRESEAPFFDPNIWGEEPK